MKQMKFGLLLVIAVLTLISVASALPTTATGYLSATYPGHPGGPYYWNLNIASTSPAQPPIDPDLAYGNHGTYCTQSANIIGTGTHTFDVFSSLQAPSQDPAIPTAAWPKINWALNNKPVDANWKALQMLIWKYDGQSGATYPWHASLGTITQADKDNYDALYTEAQKHPDFVVDCEKGTNQGPVYAIILLDKKGGQHIITEGTETCTSAPEFPTLALPLGMLVGLIGVVYVIRGRNN